MRALFAMVLVVVVLALPSVGQAQKKPQLPKGWSKLGLSAAQKADAYKLLTEYRDKTDKLKAEIKKLEEERDGALLKLLTDAQKKELRALLLKGLPDDKDKKTDDKKKTDK